MTKRTPDQRVHRVWKTTIAALIAAPVAVLGGSAIFRWVTGDVPSTDAFQVFFGLTALMLTVALVGATISYVLVTQDLAEQAQRTNAQAARNADLAIRM